jgi:hypothetical protein
MSLSFNNRLQAQQYDFAGTRLQFSYYQDGRLKSSDTDYNTAGTPITVPEFDRSYEYDFLGRLKKGKTGAEARGQTENNPLSRPYRMSLDYNHFGEVVNRERLHWALEINTELEYQNGRLVSEETSQVLPYWDNFTVNTTHTFDADGRPTDKGEKYDADGRLISFNEDEYTADYNKYDEYFYDGNGKKIKTIDHVISWCNNPNRQICYDWKKRIYRIVSSVIGDTGGVVDWENTTGIFGNQEIFRRETSIYASGEEIAKRKLNHVGTTFQGDMWFIKSTDPSGVEHTEVWQSSGNLSYNSVTTDPYGAGIGTDNPYPTEPPDDPNYPECDYDFDHDDQEQCSYPGDFDDPASEEAGAGSAGGNTCYVDGREENCDEILKHPERYGLNVDEPGASGESKHGDAAPSEEGPDNIHRDDDASDDAASAEERLFEIEYTGMEANFKKGALGVEIMTNADYGIGDVWDLRRQTQMRTVRAKKAIVTVKEDTYKKALKESFEARISSQKCKDAMDKLFSKLGYKKGIQTLFNEIYDNGNLLQSIDPFNTYANMPSELQNAVAFSNVENSQRIIVANAANRNHSKLDYMSNLYGAETTTLFHELTHLATRSIRNDVTNSSHTKIAKAMLKISKQLGDAPITMTQNGKDASNPNKNTEGANTSYMNRWINTYCPPATPPPPAQ